MLNDAARFAVVDRYNDGLQSLRLTIESRLSIEGARLGAGCIRPLGWYGTGPLPEKIEIRVVAHNSCPLKASFTHDEILSCAGSTANGPIKKLDSVTVKVDELIERFRTYRAKVSTPRRP